MTIYSVMLKRTNVIMTLTTVISTRTRVISTRRVWCWHVWVWLWHSRKWLWHSYVLKPTLRVEVSFVCDEHTHECNFWAQSVILTRTSVIYTCILCFPHAECDFYTWCVIFTRRVCFIHAECNFHTHCDVETHKCDYDTYNCDFTHTRVISTCRVWWWHVWVWLWHSYVLKQGTSNESTRKFLLCIRNTLWTKISLITE
jgi:hypothetical protein